MIGPSARENGSTHQCLFSDTLAQMQLPDGLYDRLVTESLSQLIDGLRDPSCHTLSPLPPEQAAERITDALARQVTLLLDEIEGHGADKAKQQLALVNALLVHLRQQVAGNADLLIEPPQILKAVHRIGVAPKFPETGLAIPWLFTSGKGSPSLLSELRREISCCEQVDVLVSFITVAGVRKLFDILQKATAVSASGQPRTRLRILTTTYTGATEIEALDYFAKIPGCEIKVSLDGRRTRLHAKAWIFHRKTMFGSAYVGSANLSGSALLGGLEWTVKFTEQGQTELFTRAKAHFETLWNDGEFQHYDATNSEHRSS